MLGAVIRDARARRRGSTRVNGPRSAPSAHRASPATGPGLRCGRPISGWSIGRESPRLRLPNTAQSNAMVTSAVMVGTSPDQPLCALALMPETAVHPGG